MGGGLDEIASTSNVLITQQSYFNRIEEIRKHLIVIKFIIIVIIIKFKSLNPLIQGPGNATGFAPSFLARLGP